MAEAAPEILDQVDASGSTGLPSNHDTETVTISRKHFTNMVSVSDKQDTRIKILQCTLKDKCQEIEDSAEKLKTLESKVRELETENQQLRRETPLDLIDETHSTIPSSVREYDGNQLEYWQKRCMQLEKILDQHEPNVASHLVRIH